MTKRDPARCAAENAAGHQCKNRAKANSEWCGHHQFFPVRRYPGEEERRKQCPTPGCEAFANLIEFNPTEGNVALRFRCGAGHSFQERFVRNRKGNTWVHVELMSRPDWMPEPKQDESTKQREGKSR